MQIDPRWTGRAHPRVLRRQSDRMQWLHPRENLWGRTMRCECQPSFLVVRYRLCSFILLRWTTIGVTFRVVGAQFIAPGAGQEMVDGPQRHKCRSHDKSGTYAPKWKQWTQCLPSSSVRGGNCWRHTGLA